MWRIIQLVAALCIVRYSVVAFPSGAPNGVCQTLAPDASAHGPPQPLDTFPYTVTCERTAPNMIKMRLEGATFRGLLAQVRAGERFLGTVQLPDNNVDYQTICQGSGVTHTDNNDKTNAEFNIMVPEGEFSNPLSCVVTVVQTRPVYWIAHRTPLAQPANMNAETTSQQPDITTNEPTEMTTEMTTEMMNANPTTMMITADMNIDNTTPQQPINNLETTSPYTTTTLRGQLNDIQRRNLIITKLRLIRVLLERCIQRFGNRCRLLVTLSRGTRPRQYTQRRAHVARQPKNRQDRRYPSTYSRGHPTRQPKKYTQSREHVTRHPRQRQQRRYPYRYNRGHPARQPRKYTQRREHVTRQYTQDRKHVTGQPTRYTQNREHVTKQPAGRRW